jgi:YacP-like NYN domain
MIIIIDAYNVLKQVIPKQEISDKERNHFIAQMGRYAKIKQHKIIVVFDGGPYEWVHREKMNGTIVIYSGVHESADDVIKHYLEDHQAKDLLLVSTDREINAVASRLDIPSIDAKDFYILVKHALHKEPEEIVELSGDVVKITKEEQADIDALMHAASEFVPVKKEDVVMEVRFRLSSAYTEGKKNKKLLRVLKKL